MSISKVDSEMHLNSGETMVLANGPSNNSPCPSRPMRIAYITATLIDGTGREVFLSH